MKSIVSLSTIIVQRQRPDGRVAEKRVNVDIVKLDPVRECTSMREVPCQPEPGQNVYTVLSEDESDTGDVNELPARYGLRPRGQIQSPMRYQEYR